MIFYANLHEHLFSKFVVQLLFTLGALRQGKVACDRHVIECHVKACCRVINTP